jgi:hypothetical protein
MELGTMAWVASAEGASPRGSDSSRKPRSFDGGAFLFINPRGGILTVHDFYDAPGSIAVGNPYPPSQAGWCGTSSPTK